MNLIDDIILHISVILLNTNHYDTLWSLGSSCKRIRRLLVNNGIWHNLMRHNIIGSSIIHNHGNLWYYMYTSTLSRSKYAKNLSKIFKLALKHCAYSIIYYFKIEIPNVIINTDNNNLTWIDTVNESKHTSSPSISITINGIYNSDFIADSDALLLEYYCKGWSFTDNHDVSDTFLYMIATLDIIIDFKHFDTFSIIKLFGRCVLYESYNLVEYLLTTHIDILSSKDLNSIVSGPPNLICANYAYDELIKRRAIFTIPYPSPHYRQNLLGLNFCCDHNIAHMNPNNNTIEVYVHKREDSLKVILEIARLCYSGVELQDKFTAITKEVLRSQSFFQTIDMVIFAAIKEIPILCEFAIKNSLNINSVGLKEYIEKHMANVYIVNLICILDNADLKLCSANISQDFVANIIDKLYITNDLTYKLLSESKMSIIRLCNPQKNHILWNSWWRAIKEYEL